MTQRSYGCIPSKPHEKAAAPVHPASSAVAPADLPASADLRFTGYMPAVWDQGPLGSCTAHGGGAAYSYELARQRGTRNFTPARLFLYWNERSYEGTTSQDAGASITDTARSLNQYGAPPETDWPYNIGNFAQHPPARAYADGRKRTATSYAQVPQTQAAIQSMLASGVPVIVGILVYASFETPGPAPGTAAIPYPDTANEALLGGHCVLVCGYNSWGVIFRNSWGKSWGPAGGYAAIPWSYILDPNLGFDFWAINVVGVGVAAKVKSWLSRAFGWLA